MNPQILSSLSYGMYALGTKNQNNIPTASIVNTVFQICASPMIIGVSVNHENYTNENIKNTGEFSVSVLSEDTSGAVVGALGFTSGRNNDKLENLNYKVLREGQPVLRENICCWFLCKVVNSVETPTHTVFIAEVIAGSDETTDTAPMTYNYYKTVIKGKAPKNAPTYQAHDNEDNSIIDYVCPICGYVYNDSHHPFEELTDDYICPICKAPKSAFKIKG